MECLYTSDWVYEALYDMRRMFWPLPNRVSRSYFDESMYEKEYILENVLFYMIAEDIGFIDEETDF